MLDKDELIEEYREGLSIIRGIIFDYDGYDPNNAAQMKDLVDECFEMCGKLLRGEPLYLTGEEIDIELKKYKEDKEIITELKKENEILKKEKEDLMEALKDISHPKGTLSLCEICNKFPYCYGKGHILSMDWCDRFSYDDNWIRKKELKDIKKGKGIKHL